MSNSTRKKANKTVKKDLNIRNFVHNDKHHLKIRHNDRYNRRNIALIIRKYSKNYFYILSQYNLLLFPLLRIRQKYNYTNLNQNL